MPLEIFMQSYVASFVRKFSFSFFLLPQFKYNKRRFIQKLYINWPRRFTVSSVCIDIIYVESIFLLYTFVGLLMAKSKSPMMLILSVIGAQ